MIHDGIRLQAFDLTTEPGIELRLWLMMAETVKQPKFVVMNALDDREFVEWCADLGAPFAPLLQSKVDTDDAARRKTQRQLSQQFQLAMAAIVPRGMGPTRWAKIGSVDETQMRRRFPLIGQSWEGQQVWDIQAALRALQQIPRCKDMPRWVQGHRDLAVLALYAGMDDPLVKRFDLWNPPTSHRTGAHLLNVLTICDVPQAMAMALPKKVIVYVEDAMQEARWDWVKRLQTAIGQTGFSVRIVPAKK
jgi:hypothetical protein